jgi:hypothetical protein
VFIIGSIFYLRYEKFKTVYGSSNVPHEGTLFLVALYIIIINSYLNLLIKPQGMYDNISHCLWTFMVFVIAIVVMFIYKCILDVINASSETPESSNVFQKFIAQVHSGLKNQFVSLKPLLMDVRDRLLKNIGKYGTSVNKAMVVIIGTFVVFGIVFTFLYQFGPSLPYHEVLLFKEAVVDSPTHALQQGFYLSGISFLTLGLSTGGLGDPGLIPRILILIEGFMGLLLVGYFALCFARRTLR